MNIVSILLSVGVIFTVVLLQDGMSVSAQQVNVNAAAERAQSSPIFNPSAITKESFATGRGDIFLLQKRKLFEVSLSGETGHSTNAFLSDDQRESDTYLRERAALSVGTIIAQAYSVGASISAESTQFLNNGQLGSNVISTRLSGSRSIGTVSLGLTTGGAVVLNDDFDEVVRQIDLLMTAATEAKVTELVQASASVALGYVIADPDDFSHVRGIANARVSMPLRNDVEVSLYGSGTVRRFRNFFRQNFTEDRQDLTTRAGVNLNYALFPAVAILADVSGVANFSTLDAFHYSALDASLRVEARFAF
ncbi:MAG: hypothetical protein DHS20C03_18950 [Minwuia thermotolerans]|nr:MAG: hypothetical protein DHS20C03_18950 [Minwuia thermotolerans]